MTVSLLFVWVTGIQIDATKRSYDAIHARFSLLFFDSLAISCDDVIPISNIVLKKKKKNCRSSNSLRVLNHPGIEVVNNGFIVAFLKMFVYAGIFVRAEKEREREGKAAIISR